MNSAAHFTQWSSPFVNSSAYFTHLFPHFVNSSTHFTKIFLMVTSFCELISLFYTTVTSFHEFISTLPNLISWTQQSILQNGHLISWTQQLMFMCCACSKRLCGITGSTEEGRTENANNVEKWVTVHSFIAGFSTSSSFFLSFYFYSDQEMRPCISIGHGLNLNNAISFFKHARS